MIVRTRAPVRLDFAGGWTDVAPFATERGGVVVNGAIDLWAEVELEIGTDRYQLGSRDLGVGVEAPDLDGLDRHPELGLLRAAVRRYRPGPLRVVTRSDAPPGSGLGSSGAVGVALVLAFEAGLGHAVGGAVAAERAWEIETLEAGFAGGRQDQYAAALGGFHRLDFSAGGVTVERLDLDREFLEWLADHTVACYTGQSRVSSETITRVMTKYAEGDPTVTTALAGIRAVAAEMASALRAADPVRIGALLSDNWALQQRLDARMRTPAMARLEAAVRRAGALGGKAAGAGAGGTMFFLVPGDPAEARRAAAGAGATVLPIRWTSTGAGRCS